MQLDDIFISGPYIGDSLAEVIKASPSHIIWCADNHIIDIDDMLYDLVKERAVTRDIELSAFYSLPTTKTTIAIDDDIMMSYHGA